MIDTDRCLQIGQVLLTIPTSYAQMGIVSALVVTVVCATFGSWTSYLLNSLYMDYRKRMTSERTASFLASL